MSRYAQYAHLDSPDLSTALLQTARERLAVRKGSQAFSDHDAVQQLFADDPALYELHRYRVQGGTGLPAPLQQPVVKQDTTVVQAYASLDFQETQDTLRATARADALTKGLQARSDGEVMDAYFQAHPDAYAVYRYKANGGEGVPAHLRGVETAVRKSADEIVLLTKVVDDPELRDLDRLRRLSPAAFRQEVGQLARSVVRKSAELKDVSDAFALDVLLSYREDLYRLWQEKQAA
jgi:hypothetical protein